MNEKSATKPMEPTEETTLIPVRKSLHTKIKIESAKRGLLLVDAATQAFTAWLNKKD